ncbi:hypothetical protein [Marinobacter zhejiangensis]|uniref:Lipoprotein n=1 Tax=Marinobacter zhejiangensis TaxID=488535 RepID=A0A1I4NDK8_9GAMM|nr:hypothetical protein [Marinobacter zhejiangensis]SFM13475.1 hypothetical protein SAMN04487963_1310 [Marinobacter zhejiangensis]
MRLKLFLLLFVFLAACQYLPSALTKDDVDQYIEAYKKLAEISPELEVLRTKSGSISVFTCSACKARMETSVVSAGYRSLESFMVMDLRMSYTMRYVLYLELTQLVSEAGEDIPIENVCSVQNRNNLSEADRQTFDDYCGKAVLYTGYIERVSRFVSDVVEYIVSKADFEIVAESFDEIHSAITDPRLISDLSRSGGGGWDD